MRPLLVGTAVNLLEDCRLVTGGSGTVRVSMATAPDELVAPDRDRRSDSGGPGFGPPVITFHMGWRSLVDALFGVRVAPLDRSEGDASVSFGALLPGPGALGSWLGLTLDDDAPYGLIAATRQSGRCEHEVVTTGRRGFERQRHLTAVGRRAEARLRPGPRPGRARATPLTGAMVQAYLDFFSRFGTHFVSSVDRGDTVAQVVSLPPGIEGSAAVGRYLASNPGTSCGSVVSLAGDRGLVTLVESAPGSMLSFSDHGKRLPCEGREAVGQIGFTLTPVSRFLEHYRSHNAVGILTAALVQHFGGAVDLPLSAGTLPADTPFVTGGHVPGVEPGRWLYGERLTTEALARPRGLEAAAGLIVNLSPAAVVRAPRVLAGVRLSSETRSTAELPVLEVEPDFALAVASMHGMIRVVNRSTAESQTIWDGHAFATEHGVSRVRVAGTLSTLPPPAVTALAPLFECYLLTTRRLLTTAGPERDAAVTLAMQTLAWLLDTLHSPAPGLRGLRRNAIAQLWSWTWFPSWPSSQPLPVLTGYVRDLLEAARTEGGPSQAAAVDREFWQTPQTPALGVAMLGDADRRLTRAAERLAQARQSPLGRIAMRAVDAVRPTPTEDGKPGHHGHTTEAPGVAGAVDAVTRFHRRVRRTAEDLERLPDEPSSEALERTLAHAVPPVPADWRVLERAVALLLDAATGLSPAALADPVRELVSAAEARLGAAGFRFVCACAASTRDDVVAPPELAPVILRLMVRQALAAAAATDGNHHNEALPCPPI